MDTMPEPQSGERIEIGDSVAVIGKPYCNGRVTAIGTADAKQAEDFKDQGCRIGDPMALVRLEAVYDRSFMGGERWIPCQMLHKVR